MVPPYSHRVSRVRRYSGYNWSTQSFAYETITPYGVSSHTLQLDVIVPLRCPNPEGIATLGLACSAFARHYLRNRFCFLFLSLLRCFSSGGSLYASMYSMHNDGFLIRRIAPFGYLWITACLRLPIAFRSLPRPSSAPGAKAFALRPS